MVFSRFRKTGFWLVSGLVVTIGDVSHVFAAELAATRRAVPVTRTESVRKAPVPTRTVEVFDDLGNPVAVPTPTSPNVPKALTATELTKVKQEAIAATFGTDAKRSQLAARQLKLVAVLEAKTAAARHAAVEKLGVQVVNAAARDGRTGTIKTFSVAGKSRLRVFVPQPRSATPQPMAHPEEGRGGPSAHPEETGRWKIGGACYWDENDTGADQCSPNPGRWKVGSEGCYFDGNDDGPDQCEPAVEATAPGDADGYECDGDCATKQQLDDLYAAIAYAESEYAAMEVAVAEVESYYCAVNPGECFGDEVRPASGPSDARPIYCFYEKLGFLGAVYATVGVAIAGAAAVAAAPVTLTAAVAVGATATTLGGVLTAWSLWGPVKSCLGITTSPAMFGDLPVYERQRFAL